MLLAVIQNRVKEDCAHQAIKAALHGHLGAGEALLLGIGHDLQEGGLAAGLHVGAQLLHLIQRNADFLEAPIFGLGVLAGVKDLVGVLDGAVIVGQHDN